MKLLILTPQLPYPPHQGTTIRNFNIIKHLAPRHDITLISFGTAEELQNAEPLRALCRRIEIAPYPMRSLAQRAITTLTAPQPDMALRLKSDEMHAKVAAVLRDERFDVVQVEGIEMARYGIKAKGKKQKAKGKRQKAKVIFDEHNAEYVLQRTAYESDARHPTHWHAALYSLIQWKKLERYERECCASADHIVACSGADASAINALINRQSKIGNRQSKIAVIPNGVDTDHFVPSERAPLSEFTLVFAGKMDFRPNVDAMTWFCADILPRIRAEIPRARVVIVGQKPAPRVVALREQQGVEVTGWVPDTRPYIADAAVYVVPLRMGSGTRLKVLEAMAMGKAIVSTARGVEGIALTPDRDAVIADAPDAFARAVIALLREPERRRALGRAARALAAAKYDWRKIVPLFEQIYTMTNEQMTNDKPFL